MKHIRKRTNTYTESERESIEEISFRAGLANVSGVCAANKSGARIV